MTGSAVPGARPDRSFCLIRHGETLANAQGWIAGRTDVALTALGQAQARALSQRPWPDALTLVASPLSRAQETCRLAFPGQGFGVNAGLRERDWGVFETRPLSDQPRREDTPQDGEAWGDMLNRVAETVTAICAASPDALPVLVCHSGVIRAARTLWVDGTVGARPPNATPLLFTPQGRGFVEKLM